MIHIKQNGTIIRVVSLVLLVFAIKCSIITNKSNYTNIDKVKLSIEEMYKNDQSLDLNLFFDNNIRNQYSFDSIIAYNTKEIKVIYSKYSYVAIEKIDSNLANKYHLLLLHSNDIHLQNKYKNELENLIIKNNDLKINYAFLVDAILMKQNKKLIYGIYLDRVENKFYSKPLEYPLKVDSFRNYVGLPNLKIYINRMNDVLDGKITLIKD